MIGLGIVIGLLIGLTGIGSGSLLTPALILLGGMPPATAVGTSLVFSFVTKLYGSWNFYRRGLVKREIVGWLLWGGLPGVLVGVVVIQRLRLRSPEVMNAFLLRAIGLALVLVSVIMLLRLLPLALRPAAVDRLLPLTERQRRLLMVLAGFGVGVSVTLTSIGSGTAVIPALVLLYRLDSGALVGTSVFLGTILTGLAGIPHLSLGNIEWKALAALLCGSVPGLWLASHVHGRFPRHIPEGIIAAVLMALGIRIFAF